MSDRPVTTDVSGGSQYKASHINANFAILETAIEGCLGRGGTSENPNSMQGDLDMNLNSIRNLPQPFYPDEPVRLGDITEGTFPVDLADITGECIVVDNVDDLRLMVGVEDQSAMLKGYYTPGDGGGGPLRVWKTGTYVDNGGSIIVPTGGDGSGAWVWEWSGAVNVKWFGAKGDPDETTILQKAIDSLSTGGVVFFPAGTYRVQNLKARDNIKCLGVAGKTILKVVDGVDKQIFYNENQALDIPVDHFQLEDIIFDGNKALSPKVTAVSVVAINGATNFVARNCTFQNGSGYGMGFQAYPGGSFQGAQDNIYLENCRFDNNGDGIGGGADTFDGLDIKYCADLKMIGCSASNNSDGGINIRGERVSIVGGFASSNGGGGYVIAGNHNVNVLESLVNVSDCSSFGNGASGFAIFDGAIGATGSVRVNLNNIISYGNLFGVQIPAAGERVQLTASNMNIFSCTSHGVTVGATTLGCYISNSIIRGNTGSGVYVNGAKVCISSCQLNLNTRYGVEEGANANRTIVEGAGYVQSNTLGSFLFNSNNRLQIGSTVKDHDIGSGDVAASAASATLPHTGGYIVVTGTTNITSITASSRGRIVTLHFSGILTVTDGGNLVLAGNFVTSSGDTLTIVCDGTNWLEVARSTN